MCWSVAERLIHHFPFLLFLLLLLLLFYRAEMDIPEASVRFGLMLEAYLRGSVNHMSELRRQVRVRGKGGGGRREE